MPGEPGDLFFSFFLFKKFSLYNFYLFIFVFGCAGSSLPYGLFCSWGKRGLYLQCVGFSLRWLLLLQSLGSRHRLQ